MSGGRLVSGEWAEDWVPEGIDWHKPSAARVYDVHLGGAHNFAVDREIAARITKVMPDLPELLRANRSFLRRAVRLLVDWGITQFLDLGSGIPTVGNVHEIAQQANPACRVVYVDIDPVAVAHSRRILAGNPLAQAIQCDLRRPDEVLAHPVVRDLLDFARPIAVLLVAVLHFVSDADQPAALVSRYMKAVVPGSYLALSHATYGGSVPRRAQDATELYARNVENFWLRDREQITACFDSVGLVDPGVVYVAAWRPETPTDALDAERLPQLGGLGRRR